VYDWKNAAPKPAAQPAARGGSNPLLNVGLTATPMAWPAMLINAQRQAGQALVSPARAAAPAAATAGTGAMADVARWAGAANNQASSVFKPESGVMVDMSRWASAPNDQMSPLFQRGSGGSAPTPAPAPRVGPGSPITPGPGMGAPAAVVTRPEVARAEEANRAYQQAGGDISKNYWEANPEIRKAALEGPKATEAGYSERADIKAWMDAQIAKGPAGKAMVDRFLADQERKGLIRRADPLGNAYDGGADAAALQGQPGLGEAAKQAPWNSAGQNSTFGQEGSPREYAVNQQLAPGLGGAEALGQRNAAQVFAPGPIPGTEAAQGSLQAAASQAPWATGAPGGIESGIGNFKTSGEMRALNLAGNQALAPAHVNQAMATRPEPGATAAEPQAPPAERPEDSLLNSYIRNIGQVRSGGLGYGGGNVIGGGLF
jgi:hypothetical protein